MEFYEMNELKLHVMSSLGGTYLNAQISKIKVSRKNLKYICIYYVLINNNYRHDFGTGSYWAEDLCNRKQRKKHIKY